MFDILLFDLDDTLLDFHKGEEIAFKEACLSQKVVYSNDFYNRYKQINESYWKLLEKGETTVAQLVIDRFRDLFAEYHLPLNPKEFNDCYFNYLRLQHPAMPHAFELLEQLKNKRIFIVTNGEQSVQAPRISDSGMIRYVKDVFVSQKIGFEKPSIEFFNYVAKNIPDFDKKKTIIIGDSLTSDMMGGISFGITTCWYNFKQLKNIHHIPVDYEIKDLLELLPIVDEQ